MLETWLDWPLHKCNETDLMVVSLHKGLPRHCGEPKVSLFFFFPQCANNKGPWCAGIFAGLSQAPGICDPFQIFSNSMQLRMVEETGSLMKPPMQPPPHHEPLVASDLLESFWCQNALGVMLAGVQVLGTEVQFFLTQFACNRGVVLVLHGRWADFKAAGCITAQGWKQKKRVDPHNIWGQNITRLSSILAL